MTDSPSAEPVDVSSVERYVVLVPVGDALHAELVADRLLSLGASAVSEVAGEDGRVALVADLLPRAVAVLEAAGVDVAILTPDASWADGWRDHAVAVVAGQRFVVRPEWVPRDDAHAGRIEVVVDAAHAFGSGSHATTRLCLEALEGHVDQLPADCRVLDVGCGTGVLGAAALLSGAGSLVAVDVDPAAVESTRRTLFLNGVGERAVEVSQRTVAEVADDHGPFDLVLANLLIPIVEDLGPAMSAALAPSGSLIVSGLLAEGDPRVGSNRASGHVARAGASLGDEVDVVEVLESEGWAALVCRSPP